MERTCRRVRALALALLFGGPFAVQAQGPPPVGASLPDRPSNGVFQLTVEPVLTHHVVKRDAPPPMEDGRQPWEGLVWIRLTNITRGTVTVNDGSPNWFYLFEVLDSAGRPVARTPYGEQVAMGKARTHPPSGPRFASTLHLAPLESASAGVELSLVFQIKLGYAYTVKVRRPLDSGTRDEAGNPLPPDERELTCSVYVPGKNADQ